MSKPIAQAILSTLCLAAIGCGGGLSVDIDPDRRVSTLVEPEAMEICLASQDLMAARFDAASWGAYSCARRAAESIEFCLGDFSQCVIECQQTAYNCEGRPELVTEDLHPSDCLDLEQYDYEGCPVRVEDLSSCLDELAEAMAAYPARMTCQHDAEEALFEGMSPTCIAVVDNSSCNRLIFGR